MNISTKKLHAIRYCYQNSKNTRVLNAVNKTNTFQKLCLLALIIVVITQLYFKDIEELYPMIILLFCILVIEIFSFFKYRGNIDLNEVENYLLNFASIEQVVSIELYQVSPKIKVICAKLMVSSSNKLRLDLLNKNIQSDLSHYFGLTESVITLKNSLGNTTGEQARSTNEKMLNNFQALDFHYERYLSLKKQASEDFN